MNYTTKEIAEITQSQIIGDKNLQIHHIAFDSRNIYSTLKTAFTDSKSDFPLASISDIRQQS